MQSDSQRLAKVYLFIETAKNYVLGFFFLLVLLIVALLPPEHYGWAGYINGALIGSFITLFIIKCIIGWGYRPKE